MCQLGRIERPGRPGQKNNFIFDQYYKNTRVASIDTNIRMQRKASKHSKMQTKVSKMQKEILKMIQKEKAEKYQLFDTIPFVLKETTLTLNTVDLLLQKPECVDNAFEAFFHTVRVVRFVMENPRSLLDMHKTQFFHDVVIPDAMRTIFCLAVDPVTLLKLEKHIANTEWVRVYKGRVTQIKKLISKKTSAAMKVAEWRLATRNGAIDDVPNIEDYDEAAAAKQKERLCSHKVDREELADELGKSFKVIMMRVRLWNNMPHHESLSRMLPFCANKEETVFEYVQACFHELQARMQRRAHSVRRQMSARLSSSRHVLRTLIRIRPKVVFSRDSLTCALVMEMLPTPTLPPGVPETACWLCGKPQSDACDEEQAYFQCLVMTWFNERTFCSHNRCACGDCGKK